MADSTGVPWTSSAIAPHEEEPLLGGPREGSRGWERIAHNLITGL